MFSQASVNHFVHGAEGVCISGPRSLQGVGIPEER